MNPETSEKLEALRSDYEALCGQPFAHFYCPILFCDDDVPLCQAHIVNRAFSGSNRSWTVQRADVDSFYGSRFEADFVDSQYFEGWSPESAIADRELSRRLRPKVVLGGRVVEHFKPSGTVPENFSEITVGGPSGELKIGLKIQHDDALDAMAKGCEVVVERDLQTPAFVFLLKAAHLSLFHMLGYRYALSPGGHFLGRTILGDFFVENRRLEKAAVVANAARHFHEFANMVRPAITPTFRGTIDDGLLFVCELVDGTPWALLTLVRTSDEVAAVVVPIMDAPDAAARFVSFLRQNEGSLRARRCRFEDEKWKGAKEIETLQWPKANWQ